MSETNQTTPAPPPPPTWGAMLTHTGEPWLTTDGETINMVPTAWQESTKQILEDGTTEHVRKELSDAKFTDEDLAHFDGLALAHARASGADTSDEGIKAEVRIVVDLLLMAFLDTHRVHKDYQPAATVREARSDATLARSIETQVGLHLLQRHNAGEGRRWHTMMREAREKKQLKGPSDDRLLQALKAYHAAHPEDSWTKATDAVAERAQALGEGITGKTVRRRAAVMKW